MGSDKIGRTCLILLAACAALTCLAYYLAPEQFAPLLQMVWTAGGGQPAASGGARRAPEPVPLTDLRAFGEATESQRIVAVGLDVELLPLQGALKAHASVTFEPGAAQMVRFLLNDGLAITSAEVNGTPAAFSRERQWVTVRAPAASGQGQVLLELDYEGMPVPFTAGRGHIGPDNALLPFLTLWYPTDLRSFASYRQRVTVPKHWVAAVAGPFTEHEAGSNHRVFAWESPRPLFGTSLAAGPFRRTTRGGTGARYAVYYEEGSVTDPKAYLTAIESSHQYHVSRLGDDGFRGLSLVVTESCAFPFHGGNAVAVAPPLPVNGVYLTAARLTAHNWWGASVTGRWLTDRPEGSAWLVWGFAEHAAWKAYGARYGTQALLRMRESMSVPLNIPEPLKSIGMVECIQPGKQTRALLGSVAPFTVHMLAERTGAETFEEACRRLLAIYGQSSLSQTSIQQEFELIHGKGLGDFFDAWLEQTGRFDYAIASVDPAPNSVRVTIENRGSLPCTGAMPVALIHEEGVTMEWLEVGPVGGVFTVELDRPLVRVALDPLFDFPDTTRRDNVWPRRRWPVDIAARSEEAAALTVKEEWRSRYPDRVVIREPEPGVFREIDSDDPIVAGPFWSPEGKSLAFSTGTAFVWRRNGSIETAPYERNGELAGWWDTDTLVFAERGEKSQWLLVPLDGRRIRAYPCRREPREGTLRAAPSARTAAYVAADTGDVVVYLAQPEKAFTMRLAAPCAGEIGWTQDGRLLAFLDVAGNAYLVEPHPGRVEPSGALGQSVSGVRISPGGQRAAWLGPGGELRTVEMGTSTVQSTTVPGEIVAFDWVADSRLVCLTATMPEGLPGLFHGRYALWVVSARTLESLPLEMELAGLN